MKYLIITFSILLYTTISVISRNRCTCSQIINQNDCILNNQCMWNNTICSTRNCSNIYYQQQCAANSGCFYNSSSRICSELKSCVQINATSTQQCASQSEYCGLYNTESKQCYNLTIAACNSYTVQQECLYSAQGQLCFWNDSKCEDFNCNLIEDQSQCNYYNLYCTWNINNQQCIPATCNNKPTSECSLVIQNLTNVQPCFIDQSQRPAQCKDASLSDLSFFECSINTLNLATWSDESIESGSCQFCYAYLINIFSLALLIMIQ